MISLSLKLLFSTFPLVFEIPLFCFRPPLLRRRSFSFSKRDADIADLWSFYRGSHQGHFWSLSKKLKCLGLGLM
jgi:hypothetical protein